LVPQLDPPSSWQIPRGSGDPITAGEHLPRAPGRAQVWQDPVQSLLQQTPSTHFPDWHCEAMVQSWPSPRGPQLPPLHTAGAAHSVSVVQLRRQLPSAQTDGMQEIGNPSRQVPSPSHWLAGTNRSLPLQPESLQMVPVAYLAQPPWPLQKPLWPQVSGPSCRHSS
jgi:hypothetical protein